MRTPLVIAVGLAVTVLSPAAAQQQPQIVTSDIVHFWEAYDSGGKAGDTAVLRRLYLDRASPGLKDFIDVRGVTALRLAGMLRAYPRYFAAIHESNLAYATGDKIVPAVRRSFARIKELYPAATFPPVTFVIGRFSTGGTTSGAGLLIGAEFYSLTTGTPLDELSSFARTNVHAADSVVYIIAHEHVHVLQDHAGGINGSGNPTLLEQSLVEGVADFVGEMVSGGNINAKGMAFGLQHEASLWAEFKAQMNGKDASRWLYNQGSATADRPGDLGYFVGYRIAQAYYNSHADKRAALADILAIKDAARFLAQSGYDPK